MLLMLQVFFCCCCFFFWLIIIYDYYSHFFNVQNTVLYGTPAAIRGEKDLNNHNQVCKLSPPLSKRGERRKIWRSRARKVSVFLLFYFTLTVIRQVFFFFVVFWLQQVLLFEPFGFTFLWLHTPEKTGGKGAFICVCVIKFVRGEGRII